MLDSDQFARAAAYGTRHEVVAGDLLYDVGDENCDLILIESATAEVVRTPTASAPEELFLTAGAGQYLGEMNLLTGQSRILAARVSAPGTIHRIDAEQFRRLMAQDTEISDLLVSSRSRSPRGRPASPTLVDASACSASPAPPRPPTG